MLGAVLVGDGPASEVYIRLKHQAAANEAGIVAEDVRLPETTSEAELLEDRRRAERGDDAVDALLVQLPLPEGIDEATGDPRTGPEEGCRWASSPERRRLMLGRPTLVACDAAAE